jgi:hypothetical protein
MRLRIGATSVRSLKWADGNMSRAPGSSRGTPDELRELGADILANGLTTPIALWRAHPKGQAQLLDGRNRLDAIEMIIGPVEIGAPSLAAGKDFTALNSVMVLDKPVDPFVYVISANVRRRHLTTEQREAALAKIIARNPEKSDRQFAKEIGFDHKTIGRARAKGEDVGSIPHVETRIDSEGRKQPAKKKPKNAKTTTKATTAAPPATTDIGENSTAELARLRARIGELENEKRRLEIENAGLRSEIEELKTRVPPALRRVS